MTEVTRKIQKLLALAKDQEGTAEAENAMLKAQALLLKNNLTMDSIQFMTIEEEKEAIEETFNDGGKNLADWKKVLAAVIAKNFRTEALVQKNRQGTFINLVGLTEDVQVAQSIIQFAWKVADQGATEYIRQNRETTEYKKYERIGRHKAYSNAVKRDYLYGFIDGLREKFKKQVEEKALVLVKDALVVRKLRSMNIRTTHSPVKGGVGDVNASRAGFVAGKNMEKDKYIS